MSTLLLRLAGPMQSWGTRSRFNERDTDLEPSKSGVLGLVCAALGRDRADPIGDLADLCMGVRVDRQGVLRRDYQTAQMYDPKKGYIPSDTSLSNRYYLSDAAFLVGLEGDRSLLETIHYALKNPQWTLYLGRKSYPPSKPAWIEDGLRDEDLESALKGFPRIVNGNAPPSYRFVMEITDGSEGSVRMDQPLAPFSERYFGSRRVRITDVALTLQALQT